MSERPPESEITHTVPPLFSSPTTIGDFDDSTHIPQHYEGFELRDEIARGGMGIVYRARDVAMNREVAVKILQVKFPIDGSAAKRFVEEAQITGQLQHPGIPPIHHIGKLPDGRPFLSMKLIKGRTLDSLLKDRSPVNTLAVFEAIAQAVGYAHAHDVIHRDLKPANVMVGSFAEVQVMDWGLAKVLTSPQRTQRPANDPDATLGSEIRSLRDSYDETHTGSILGTPAYMPPEQAIGANDEVDASSDVFGLGAILCVMLTGRPPYLGENAESTRKLAARAKLDEAFAALASCVAEPDLVALCMRCLSSEKANRPADANAVATEVAGLRAAAEERAKQAEIAKATSDTRRRVLTWSAAAVLAVLALGIIASVMQAYRATEAKRETAAQLVKTREAETAANVKTKEVEATLAVVSLLTKLALDAFNDMVFGIQNKLANRPDTQELRKDLLENARVGLAKILAEARKRGTPDSTLVWSHFRMGDVERSLGNTIAAQKEYRRGFDLAEQLAAADQKNAGAQRDLSAGYGKLGDVTRQLGNTKDAIDFYRKSMAIARTLVDADPKNAEYQRALSLGFDRLGDTTWQSGNTKEALDFYRKLLEIAQTLADADPKDARAQRDLGLCYQSLGDVTRHQGNTEEALEYYKKYHKIVQTLADADPMNAGAQRDLGLSYSKLGNVTRQRGDTEDAIIFYAKSLEIARTLTNADPKNIQAQRDLGFIYNKLGSAALQQNNTKDALDFCQKSLEVRRKVAEADPMNSDAQRDLGLSYEGLGNVNQQLGNTEAALDFYRKSQTLAQTLADADPKNVDAQRDLGLSFGKLGDAVREMGNTKDALDFYWKATKIAQTIADADPQNAGVQRDLGVSFGKLGNMMRQQGNTQDAFEFYRKYQRIAQTLVDADPKNAEAQRDLLVSFMKFGAVAEETSDYATAMTCYEKALAVAVNFERPEFFANEVKVLKTQISKCQAKLPSREAKP